jgi:tetratricopeptide (TPR) repeat protein
MTEREQMRTRAYYFRLTGDWDKCTQEYEKLIKKYPADVAAHNNLGICLTYVRKMPDAIAEARNAMSILPKRALYRNNLALYASYATDFNTAEDEAREVQKMDAKYATGFVSLAFAQLGKDQPELARMTYESLVQIKPSVGRAGLADVALYEGRYKDAAQTLEQAGAEDLTAGSKESAALKFAELAYVRLMQAQRPQAIAAANKALQNSQTVAVRFLAGLVLAQAGAKSEAEEMLKGLAGEPQQEPKAYAKIIEGEIALQGGHASEAVQMFSAANMLLNTWIGHFELGKAYLAAEQWVAADSEFAECLKRRGEAMALFLDEYPTYGHFPLVYYYRGRVREGMKTGAFADDFKAYLKIREKAGEDPLIADARKRIK